MIECMNTEGHLLHIDGLVWCPGTAGRVPHIGRTAGSQLELKHKDVRGKDWRIQENMCRMMEGRGLRMRS